MQWKARKFKQTPFKDFLSGWITEREKERERQTDTDRQKSIDYHVEKNQEVTVDCDN